jgi:ABC-2 type transport system ATP-binding protein
LPATDGKAQVAGFDVFENPNDVKRIIGYLPENVPLYPEMTVQSYLHFVAEIKQIPASKRKEAVEKAIANANLRSVQGRLIKNISRGFKQRVGIAQALIHDPQVLILDEPTIGLDPAQIIEIRQLIKSLKGEHTIMLSTHILAEVTQTCDGVVIINEGKLMASGSLKELTASLQEKEGIFLRLREGGKDKVEHFQNLPGVDRVTIRDDGFRIEWAQGKDIRDDLTRYIVERNWGLVEMRPLAMDIEELYLRVITGETEQ